MREYSKSSQCQMEVVDKKISSTWKPLASKRRDQKYQTAVVVRTYAGFGLRLNSAISVDLENWTGDLNRFSFIPEEESEIVQITYPQLICLIMEGIRKNGLRACTPGWTSRHSLCIIG